METRAWIVLMLSVVCLLGCESSNEEPRQDLTSAQQALNQNIALWQQAGISTYQYTFRKMCYCPPLQGDVVVMVVNGQVSEAFRIPSGTYLSMQELAGVFPVEGLFARVQEAIDSRVAKLEVTYNAQRGFPEYISIDHNLALIDDEIGYTARDFQ
jgi:hypothetical protein